MLAKAAIEVKEEPSEPEEDHKSGGTDLDVAEAKLGQIMKGSEAAPSTITWACRG